MTTKDDVTTLLITSELEPYHRMQFIVLLRTSVYIYIYLYIFVCLSVSFLFVSMRLEKESIESVTESTKTEINNEWNVNFLQNSHLHIQHPHSCEEARLV